MKLHEYQSKALFAQYGIPIPKGEVASTPEDARRIARDLGGRVVVKAQVLVGGRGKAGGIKLAHSPDEAERLAAEVLAMEIKGLPVRKVLIDEIADIQSEIYLALTIDRMQRRVILMASAAGGIEIEEVARVTPEKIVRVAIDPFLGLREYQARQAAFGIGLDRDLVRSFARIAQQLYKCFMDIDGSLVEINPLTIVGDNGAQRLLAVDGKILLDGKDIYDEDMDVVTLRQRVGMVFQKPNPFPKSVWENVAFGPKINGYKGNLNDLVEHSLRRAALWDDVKDKLKQSGMALSGGQQQRLCIARTIAVNPEVILMDEPCSALDPRSTLQIEELMRELKKEYTIVIVTHNMQQAARASDTTVFMTMGEDRAGYVVEQGETVGIFTNPKNQLTEDYVSGRFG